MPSSTSRFESSWARIALLAVGAALIGALAPTTTHAHHIQQSIYRGTHAAGGEVTMYTFTDDGRITGFDVDGSVPGENCKFEYISHATYSPPLPVINHAFSESSGSFPFTVSGSFAAVQRASGTFRIKSATCDTGNVAWNATTRSSPDRFQCVDLTDNDGDGLVDGADPGCLAPFDNDEANSDTAAPRGGLSGKKTQKLAKSIVVTVACKSTTEDCIVSATGTLAVPNTAKVFRLKRAKKKVVPRGRKAKLRVRVPKRARRAARRALRKRKRVRAKIKVKVADAAGNTKTLRRTVRLKR